MSNDPTQARVIITPGATVTAPVGKVTVAGEAEPGTVRLGVAFPNPFNLSTTLEYELSEAGEVQLTVYSLSGQVVRRRVSGWQAAGRHAVVWDGREESGQGVGSGVYLGRLETVGYPQTRRMTLVK